MTMEFNNPTMKHCSLELLFAVYTIFPLVVKCRNFTLQSNKNSEKPRIYIKVILMNGTKFESRDARTLLFVILIVSHDM